MHDNDDLAGLVEQMEAVDWSAVPTVSAVTAATFQQRLLEAQEDAL